MPLYEYQCDACSHRFERIQKFSDPPADVCPSCGGSVRKLLSSPAIQFKGTGWYITDYAKKSSSDGKGKTDKADKADKGESKGGDSSPATSSTESASTGGSSGSGSSGSGGSGSSSS